MSRYHDTDACSKVYYDKDPLFVIKRNNFSFAQERGYQDRGRHKSSNTRIAIPRVNDALEHIKIDYQLDLISDMNTQHS